MENTVTTVSVTLVAYMAPVSNLGSATVKRAGVASSATKVNLVSTLHLCISNMWYLVPFAEYGTGRVILCIVFQILITAHTINHARMEPLAPTLVKAATHAPASLVSLGRAVRLR